MDMRLFKVTNSSIKNIINSLTIKDEVKNILNKVIFNYESSYVDFMYMLFSFYLTSYVRLNSSECSLSELEKNNIISTFKKSLYAVNYNNILIADKFDVLYGMASGNINDYVKYTTFLYEEIYNRMETTSGVTDTHEYMEDVFESIEHIISQIEASFVPLYKEDEDITSLSIFRLYIEVNDDNLFLCVY